MERDAACRLAEAEWLGLRWPVPRSLKPAWGATSEGWIPKLHFPKPVSFSVPALLRVRSECSRKSVLSFLEWDHINEPGTAADVSIPK